ncbi:MAG: hypothetical protein LBV60_23140 [Streptomyces sp.]|jgi:ABC-type Fe3+-hydroxamate transport system substrate-binding protein|nr:hypothetical protein [Streptomyces sp.]
MANTRTATSSTKPRSAARATSRPAAVEDEYDEPETSPAEAQEIEAEGHYVTAELCGEEVRVVPPSAWRTSWQRMLTQGLFDAFAEKIFPPEDYERYLELDPTVVEFMEFVQETAERVGESLGNSPGPGPSSRRTRRR